MGLSSIIFHLRYIFFNFTRGAYSYLQVFFYKAQLIGPLQLDVGLSKQSANQSPHQSMTSAEEKARADALGVSAAGARFEMQLDDWRWLRRDEIVAQLGPPSRSYSHLLRRLMIDI